MAPYFSLTYVANQVFCLDSGNIHRKNFHLFTEFYRDSSGGNVNCYLLVHEFHRALDFHFERGLVERFDLVSKRLCFENGSSGSATSTGFRARCKIQYAMIVESIAVCLSVRLQVLSIAMNRN